MTRLRLGTLVLAAAAALSSAPPLHGQRAAGTDDIRTLVGRLDLARYKATVQGLTAFGDRREGTKRNRDAVAWIEAQLKSYGCSDVERLTYTYTARRRTGGQGPAEPAEAAPEPFKGEGPGGSTIFGRGRRPTVNRDLARQPDARLRALNAEEPVDGERQEVYCTKIGTTRPDEMYIIGAHMDGHGVNQAANDDGSGTALVMELARVFSAPDVRTDRSIRFALWNNEETGTQGAQAYVEQRAPRQGVESPPGSGRYPEPKWLGMIQHDMMMFDHGAPGPDGTVSPTQRREADVNIEFQAASKLAAQSMALAFRFKAANEAYATNYPASIGPHMTNTDSNRFQDLVPSISLREAERGAEIGGGWDPHGHTPTDVLTTYSDDDFRLGLNAAQTTLAGVAQLVGAAVTRQ
ncbi:MAG: M28 family metallopeptidase [Vicinamibacterales bacterium]